jgi:hypothetical protein
MADCTYTVPDLEATGDALYGPRICDQPFINWAWPTHGFKNSWWQDGWGYDDVCNIRKPLARCLNAMWLLTYSADDYQNDDWGTDALHWGGRYVREQLKYYDDLRADCGDGGAVATTTGCQWSRQWNEWRCKAGYEETKRECRTWHWLFSWICHLYAEVKNFVCTLWGWVAVGACTLWYGTVGGGQNVTLSLLFFYPTGTVGGGALGGGNRDVISRAGTLIHEARHIGNKPHNANFPAGSIYGAGGGGADSDWNYAGAWMYEVLYLWWFFAAGTRTSIAMRQSAKQEANVILTNAFSTSPGFLVP